ncbi:MAG: hypothetical protein ACD_26C00116G0004 [uncultured bacterium]|nr:MAG: hypothetical protein ACD_26C00116G0004 [uncultured bacterium]
MEPKNSQEIALFRFSVIGPAITNTFDAHSQSQFFRDAASKSYDLPNGKKVKYSSGAIKKWFLNYKKGGIDALFPKSRKDLGNPRNLTNPAIEKIHAIREQFPYITGKLIYQKLVEEGYIKVNKTSLSTVLRYIRENSLKRNQIAPVERRAYEMEFANECWQADTSHGAFIKCDGKKMKTYLISFIDDASRLILHAEFFFNDNAVNMQLVFKKAIAKYGVPKKLLVDNGSPYKNDQLKLICASLGIALIHARPYDGAGKAKIERSFRTIKDGWLNGVDWNNYISLDGLNADFTKYMNEKYINSMHTGINMTPRNRYLKDINKIKYIPSEELENHFMHRIERRVYNDATIKLHLKLFEVPQKYIGQKINVRYLPHNVEEAFIFSRDNKLADVIYPLNKIDNSKVKRKSIDYSKINHGGDNNV